MTRTINIYHVNTYNSVLFFRLKLTKNNQSASIIKQYHDIDRTAKYQKKITSDARVIVSKIHGGIRNSIRLKF